MLPSLQGDDGDGVHYGEWFWMPPAMQADIRRFYPDPQTVPVYNGVGLPIMPSVTPGIAVAGVLLMLAGLPYCLIGIKNKK